MLIHSGRKRTSALIELMQLATRVHDACKSLLRICCRAAAMGAPSSDHPVALLKALEGVVRHPVFMHWPKRFTEDLQNKLKYIRGYLSVIHRLRQHTARMLIAITNANAVLDQQFLACLNEIRESLFKPGDDNEIEIERRCSLNRLVHMAQQLLLTVQKRFDKESMEASKLGFNSKGEATSSVASESLVHIEVGTELDFSAKKAVDPSVLSGEQVAEAFGEAFDEVLNCVSSVSVVVKEARQAIAEQHEQLQMEKRRVSVDAAAAEEAGRAASPPPPAPVLKRPASSRGGKSAGGSNARKEATAQLLEILRVELKAPFERIFEQALQELHRIDDDEVPRLDEVLLQQKAEQCGVGSLTDLSEELAHQMQADAEIMDESRGLAGYRNATTSTEPVSPAAGAAVKGARQLWARRRNKPSQSGRPIADLPARTNASYVREVSAWWALRVAASLRTQLNVATCKNEWKLQIQPVLDALYKALFIRQIRETDPQVLKVLTLESQATKVNARCRDFGSTTSSLMGKMRSSGKMLSMMGGIRIHNEKEAEGPRDGAPGRAMPIFGGASDNGPNSRPA